MDCHINIHKDAMESTHSDTSVTAGYVTGRRISVGGGRSIFALACTVGLVALCFAQPGTGPSGQSVSPTDANALSAQPFPYFAEIIGDDVNIRAGAGTNFYSCGRLYRGDRVKVVGSQSGWCRIVPPAGSFSWISMRCVSINLDNPAMGMVTGDNVHVYAGSDYVEPMHSTQRQVTLNRSDMIKLLGEEKDDYYKIVPPDGAFLWVSAQYSRPIAPVESTPPPTVPEPNALSETTPDTNAPPEVSAEAKKLEEFYVLKKQLEAERAKPAGQQNYADVKKALKAIAEDEEAGKAARYAQFMIKQIERCELAQVVAKEVQLQSEQLQQTRSQIDEARAKRLAEVKNLGRFAVMGEFQSSTIYGPDTQEERYRVIDESGKITCYAVPTGSASQTDLSKFIDQKVGLVGTIEPHPPTAGALVRFTDIVPLDS